MTVQLIIDGTHITDVLAQVQALADAVSGGAPKNEPGRKSDTTAPTSSTSTTKDVLVETTGSKTDSKTLNRVEQDAAVEEMVEAGSKDERFNMLTKGRQKDVEARLAEKDKVEETKPAEPAKDDVGSMFDDDEAAPAVEVNGDMIRDLMAKVGKDANGHAIRDKCLAIRDILVKVVPKGEEIKIGNIPAVKLADVYAAIKALEA